MIASSTLARCVSFRASNVFTVNAVVEGLIEGGAAEVRVNDSHGQMTNLLPELMHPAADLILGKTDINWTPGEAAMRGVEMLDAAYRSAVSGKEEEV